MADATALDRLLEYVRTARGFDFTGYKRASLERRITKRMQEVGVKSYSAYLDHLEASSDEFPELFNTILINVTGFFRDPATWEYIGETVLPAILAARGDDDVRVWCPGCASGEEVYTAAILLAEATGEERFRAQVKIYGTDVDEDALAFARQAVYSADELKGLDPELRRRYFDRTDGRYAFRPELRRMVIFGRNDLVQDAPISRIDLLICRNTLMYFNAETQTRILERFHFALRDQGALVLGKSEMLISHPELFTPLELKRRVFRRSDRTGIHDRYAFVVHGEAAAAPEPDQDGGVRLGAIDAAPVAQLVVDAEGVLVYANHRARDLFALGQRELGRPLSELEVSYKPVDLRSSLDLAYAEHREIVLGRVEHAGPTDTEPRTFDVQVTPVVNEEKGIGASITFADVSRQRRLQDELERSKRELETAYEELQSTVEELETTNEELHSSNEELETTNEELQSTNEELETMNEELQSTNEELETTNDELRMRGTELDRLNAFLGTILTSAGLAVIVVDLDQRVQVWNHSAEDLWKVRAADVLGRHLLELDLRVPVDDLRQPVRDVLDGKIEQDERTLEVDGRAGPSAIYQVRILPLAIGGGEISGAILLMEPAGG